MDRLGKALIVGCLVLGLPALASAISIFPASTTVEFGTKVPFVCDNGGSTSCTFSLVSGVGSITPGGVYTAPGSAGSAVIKAVNGSSSITANITVAGSIPPYTCSYSLRGPNLNMCTMQHAEFVGGTVTRKYAVIIPNNYVPGQSGLILKDGGTTHGLAADCKNAPGSEIGGWVPYLLSIPSPAPVMVCVEGWFDTGGTDNGERPNAWGFHSWNWVNGVVPNDVDLLRQILLATVKDLNLDPKKVFMTNDWYGPTSVLADEFAAKNADLVAAVGIYNDGTFARVTSNYTDTDGTHIANPNGPVSVILLASHLPSNPNQSMCGTNTNHPLTHDDIFNFWAAVDKPTSFSYGDPSGSNTQLCTGNYNANGWGTETTLEKKIGSGGVAGTEIQIWKLVGNAKGTTWCSFDWNGNDTFCNSTSGPAMDFRPPTASCTWQHPCNHFMTATTGYDILGLTYKFFLNHPKGGSGTQPPPDTTPPTVAISTPANGSTVSGTISVTANASDNVGVASVQFKADGANIGAADTSAPYSASLDTTLLANGAHTLTSLATDTSGNTGASAAVSVNVNNAAPPPPPPPPPSGGADNRYCGPGNVPQFGASDGPAQLPKACFYTALSATPSPNPPTSVPAGAALQTYINNAQCGDTLVLPAGASFNASNLTFPAKGCDDQHWITLRTSALAQLPPEGTRISPCYAGIASLPGRPSYACPTGGPAKLTAQLMLNPGTNIKVPGDHYRFIGLEVARAPGATVYAMMAPSGGSKIILDRMLLHGNATDETTRGIALNDAHHIAVIDSFLYDFHCVAGTGTCTDSQAVSGGNDSATTGFAGTFKIVNNFLEAAAENVLIGGAHSNDVPGDIEVRRNHLFKPMTWNPASPSFFGTTFIVKNHYEMKNGQRALVEGNIMENVWAGFSQVGAHILLTPKNQDNLPNPTQPLCPICEIKDITIRYNHAINGGQALQIADGPNDSGYYAYGGHNYSIHDMLFEGLLYPTCYQCGTDYLNTRGGGGTVTPPPPTDVLHDVSENHVTQVAIGNSSGYMRMSGPVLATTGLQESNIVIDNGIYIAGTYGVWPSNGGPENCASGQASPKAKFDACWANYGFAGNVMAGGLAITGQSAIWPAGNFFPANQPSVGFVNFNGGLSGDYHLAASSPYKGKATDGKDPGADIECMNAVISGGNISSCGSTPPPLPPPPPAPVLTSISLTPASASLNVGAAQQFAATGKDQNGNVMSGVAFLYSSTNTAVATINASGLATGVSASAAGVYASSGPVRSNMAVLTVTTTVPPPPPPPGIVLPQLPQAWVDENECLGKTSVTVTIPGTYPATYAGLQQAIIDAEALRISSDKGTKIIVAAGTKIANSFVDKSVQLKNGTGATCMANCTPIYTGTQCIIIDSNNPLPQGVQVGNVELTSISRNAGVVSATTALPHHFTPGAMVKIQRIVGSQVPFDGTFTIASVPGANVFTFVQSGPAESGGTTPRLSMAAQVAGSGTTTLAYQTANNLWTIQTSNTDSRCFNPDPAAHHFLITDFECSYITPATVNPFGNQLSLTSLTPHPHPTSHLLSDLPSHMGYARVYVHGCDDCNGQGPANTHKGTQFGGSYQFIVDSRYDQIHYDTQQGAGQSDSFAVGSILGLGPLKLVNNYLEASSETSLWGGAASGIPGKIVSDVEIRLNTFTKNYASWYAGGTGLAFQNHWNVKNALELKEGQRFLIDGNLFENSWVDGQAGFLVLMTPRDGFDTTVRDITFTNNILRHGAQGFQVGGRGNDNASNAPLGQAPTLPMERMLWKNNLVYDIGDPARFGTQPSATGISLGTQGIAWPGCTASRNSSNIATITCPPNAAGDSWHEMQVGDNVQVTTCADPSFNTPQDAQGNPLLGPLAVPPTDPHSLTVYYPNSGAAGASTSGCTLNYRQGFPKNATWDHNTIVSQMLNSPVQNLGLGNYPISLSYINSIQSQTSGTGFFCNARSEGTQSEACYDLATLNFHHTVMQGRTASFYTEYPGAVSPPATVFFPAGNSCSGAPNSACLGFAGNYGAARSSAGLGSDADDYNDYRLCSGAGVPSPACSGASYFSAGHPGQAADGKDMGADIAQIETHMTLASYGAPPPPPVVAVAVSPMSASLASGATLQYTATITGTSNTTVTWSATKGSISAGGLFTAPTTTFTITATVTAKSVVDPTKSASASVTVTGSGAPPDTTPPTVAISVPVNGATVSGTITLTANAADNVAVANVQFKLDGANLGAADASSPYSASFDTTLIANGAHTLTAIATDTSGNTGTSAVINVTVSNSAPPPVGVSISPTTAALASGGTQQFVATVTGSTNTAVTYSATKGSVSAAGLFTAPSATFTITAIVTATSKADPTKSASAVVTVTGAPPDTTPPTVAISVPVNGATVSGTITLTANASDNVGVAGVQFQLDGVDLGAADATAPYSVSWNTALAAEGNHVLSAIVTDTSGNRTVSAIVTVRVVRSLNPKANVPGLRSAFVYPDPALSGQAPVIRAALGLADSVGITIYDESGRAVQSADLPSTPTGVDASGDYYYEYAWTGHVPSGVYYYIVHGKSADGTVVRARGRFAVLR